MPRKPRDEQCIEALTYVARAGGNTAAARLWSEESGEYVSRERVRDWAQQGKERGLQARIAPEDGEASRQRAQIIGLQDQVKALEAELRNVQRDNLTAEVIRKHILGLKEQTPEPPGWLISVPKRGKAPHVPSVLWSDWHWGEVVDPAELNGINSYDLGVAHKRASALLERTSDIAMNYGPGNYPGIVVNLGGDMISGNIHDELTETNEMPVMPIIVDILGVLIKMLKTLADLFGRVVVFGVPGNHGRDTPKPRLKQRSYTNFDWLIYALLELNLRDDERIVFKVPTGTDCYYRIYNHRFMLTHGDNLGVQGGDGIIGALGPILRGDFKARNQAQAMRRSYDTLLMGHWHQWLPLAPRLIVNGSLKGFDEFAKLKLRAMPERPTQGLWFNHPENGIVSAVPIFVDDEPEYDEAEWVSVAA